MNSCVAIPLEKRWPADLVGFFNLVLQLAARVLQFVDLFNQPVENKNRLRISGNGCGSVAQLAPGLSLSGGKEGWG